MATEINSLSAYDDAQAALATNFQSTLAVLQDADYSEDPASPYQQAHQLSLRITREMQALAVLGLKQVDDEIAASGLVAGIGDAASEAKREAERIANATKTVSAIADAVGAAASVVTKLSGLPFLA